MAVATRCTTPGAVFNTHLRSDLVEIVVTLPQPVTLTAVEAGHLEDTIHNALELALAPLFLAAGGVR